MGRQNWNMQDGYFGMFFILLLLLMQGSLSIYLGHAKLEEDYGDAKRAMKIYEEAIIAVPYDDKLSMYEIYTAPAAEIFGVTKTREIYVQAITSDLLDKDEKAMCLKYAEFEKSLGEIDRAQPEMNVDGDEGRPIKRQKLEVVHFDHIPLIHEKSSISHPTESFNKIQLEEAFSC